MNLTRRNLIAQVGAGVAAATLPTRTVVDWRELPPRVSQETWLAWSQRDIDSINAAINRAFAVEPILQKRRF